MRRVSFIGSRGASVCRYRGQLIAEEFYINFTKRKSRRHAAGVTIMYLVDVIFTTTQCCFSR